MFALSLTICEAFANLKKCHTFDKGRVNFKDEKNGTCAIRLQMFDCIMVIFFLNLSYIGIYVCAKGNIHIRTHAQREAGVLTIDKSAKQICIKSTPVSQFSCISKCVFACARACVCATFIWPSFSLSNFWHFIWFVNILNGERWNKHCHCYHIVSRVRAFLGMEGMCQGQMYILPWPIPCNGQGQGHDHLYC